MVGQILFDGWGWLLAVGVVAALLPALVWGGSVGPARLDAGLLVSLGLCALAALAGLAWAREILQAPQYRLEDDLAQCGAALTKYAPVMFQGYEEQACARAGVNLREIELDRRAHPRQLTTRERQEADRQWRTRRWGAQPYDRARFCATPGLSCLD